MFLRTGFDVSSSLCSSAPCSCFAPNRVTKAKRYWNSNPARFHRTAGGGFYTCADTKGDTELDKRALLEEKQEISIWAVDTHTCQQKQQEQGLKTKLQTI